MDEGMDGIIRLIEARVVRGEMLRDHLYIHRCLSGLQGCLRSRRLHLVLGEVGTNEKGNGNEGENESEGGMEDHLWEVGVELGTEVGGLMGGYHIHRHSHQQLIVFARTFITYHQLVHL